MSGGGSGELWTLGGAGRRGGGLDWIRAKLLNCRWVAVAPTMVGQELLASGT